MVGARRHRGIRGPAQREGGSVPTGRSRCRQARLLHRASSSADLWDGRAKPLIAEAAAPADARPSFLFGQHGNRVIADHLLEFQFKIVNLLRISGIS